MAESILDDLIGKHLGTEDGDMNDFFIFIFCVCFGISMAFAIENAIERQDKMAEKYCDGQVVTHVRHDDRFFIICEINGVLSVYAENE